MFGAKGGVDWLFIDNFIILLSVNFQYCEMVSRFLIGILADTQRLRDNGTFRPSTALDKGVALHNLNLEVDLLN